MIQHVSPLHLRQKLGDVLNRVALRQDEFVVERKGQPLAAVVSVEKLKSMQELARLELLKDLKASRSRLTGNQADALANEVRHLVRKRRKRRR